ncbi:MAG: dehydrogenase [Bdellovibrionaceae bacterium]|nr:dehydrogenase [Pseudobdellovibrionaceae bacterium]
MKNSFRIAEISFGRSVSDGAFEFDFEGSHFEVQRFGTNYNADNVQALIRQFRNDVDAFALSSLPPVIRMKNQSYVHRNYLDILGTPSPVPLCDGSGLKEISNLNSLIRLVESGAIKPQDGVFFPMALHSIELEEYIRKSSGGKVFFGDAYAMFGLEQLVRPFPGLMTMSQVAMNIAGIKDLSELTKAGESRLLQMGESELGSKTDQFQYVFGDLPALLLLRSSPQFLRGKDLVIWSHHDLYEQILRKAEPRSIVNLMPEEYKKISPRMNYSILDAVLRLKHKKTAPLSMEEWESMFALRSDVLPVVRRYASTSRPSTQAQLTHGVRKVTRFLKKENPPDFAFIIHALSHRDFEQIPGVKQAMRFLPQNMNDGFDRLISKAPPIVYGHVNHVISESTGREVNGILYGLFATPKVLRETPPEVTYAKIEKICYDAASRGAKIIGLGAYTKIIGDSGVTINRNSPIPVTTGNSLSASATLWGLYEAIAKMGLLKKDPGTGRFDGMAMVVGATGSIGSVSAKLLSLAFKKICLVAPRMNRLEELAQEIRRMSPDCEVILTTEANHFAEIADALVTATSALDQKIIDVMKLKPGCVVCDCSRPLDFTAEDAKKRPDVLIIESGEVVLPGPYEMDCDLGLPGKTVYACLAETALLSLEGRHEAFTIGRDIDWIKVKEIYKLALKHGVRLSSIEGHMGTIKDREIDLIRELALSKR